MASLQPSSRQRALLIGSATGQLTGVQHDLDAMHELLEGRQFQVRRRAGELATRAGILQALRDLEQATTGADTVVIYYSGHGGRLQFRGRHASTGAGDGFTWAYLVPHGGSSVNGRFNGVLDLELSVFAAAMDRRCGNVTLILDCCYSGDIGRDEELGDTAVASRVRAVGPRIFERPAWLSGLLGELAVRPRLASESHPHIVRAVASSSDTLAHEIMRDDGSYEGAFTAALVAELNSDIKRKSSWKSIIKRVRERVFARRRSDSQRPEVAGPTSRAPFARHSVSLPTHACFTLCRDDGTSWIRAGQFLGLASGDRVSIDAPSLVRPLQGRLRGVGVDVASIELPRGVTPPHADAEVRLLACSSPLHVAITRANVGGLCARIEASPWLAVASGHGAAMEIQTSGDHLLVCSSGGDLRRPMDSTSVGLDQLIRDLEAVARAAKFVEAIASPPGLADPSVKWRSCVHVDTPGGAWVLGEKGARLHRGDKFWIELRNRSARGTQRLFFSIVDIGVSGRASVLNQSQPGGLPLSPGATREIGRRPGAPIGLELSWPPDVPDDRVRTESLFVLVSYAPVDLRELGQAGLELAREVRLTGDEQGPPSHCWDVARHDFELVPHPRA